jgi:hypothetical protein
MKIDITGLDKAEVLAALYNASRPQGLGVLHYRPGDMSVDDARKLLVPIRGRFYFDYVGGRPLKVDINERELDVTLYDRNNGDGAAVSALQHLLSSVVSDEADLDDLEESPNNLKADLKLQGDDRE